MRVKSKAMPLRLLGVAVFASFATALAGRVLPASALDITTDNSNYVVPAEGSTKNIVVKSGTNATITLDGNLTVTGSHAIAVEEGAVLTIKGTGTVEAIGKEFTPLYNNGTTTIDGGAFYKNAAKGSGYAIYNDRDMVINNATVLMDTGDAGGSITSSLIENGGVADGVRNLTINGGTFTGGVDNVKNDAEGILVVNGGTFTNTINQTIYNMNVATINGGTFNVPSVPDDGAHVNAALHTSAPAPSTIGKGILVINGGTYNADAVLTTDAINGLNPVPAVQVTSGVFNTNKFYADGYTQYVDMDRDGVDEPYYVDNSEHFSDSQITGGTFTNPDIELPALPEGYFKYDVVDPATKEPVSIVTDEEVVFDDAPIDYTMKVGDKYVMDLPELVLQYGVFNNFVGGLDGTDGGSVELDGNSVVATSAGHAAVTVSFNGKTRTYNFVIADAATDVPDVTPPVSTDENTDIAAPNTGIATDATSGAADGASILATITTALAMLVVLAGIRIAAKEND